MVTCEYFFKKINVSWSEKWSGFRQILIFRLKKGITMHMALTKGNNAVYYMTSSASAPTRAGKMERYCALGIARFAPAIKFLWSPIGCTKVFFCKIFSVTVKRFTVISLSGWNLKTRKPKTSTRMKTEVLMSFKNTFCNKNRQTQN